MYKRQVPKSEDLENATLELELEVYDSYGEETSNTDNISITINSLYKTNSINIIEGQSLYSLSVIPDDRSVSSVFEDLVPLGAHKVIGEGTSAFWNESLNLWMGNLTNIDPRHGYWIYGLDNLDGEDDVIGSMEHVGIPIDCSLEYDFDYGANLFSYGGNAEVVAISDAISQDEYPEFYECNGTKSIIGNAQAAFWSSAIGEWMGSLDELRRDKGYWITTCSEFTLNWSCDEG